ncbi:MAG: hypothetical protein M3Y41_07465 [Pseudomonadota bacterium]|nr:hypothetical protein [Pseudomonadota bacterium]
MPCTRSSASSRAGGGGHAAKHPGTAFLQTFEHQRAAGEVNPISGERQRLGQPAAGIGQRHAQGPHLTVGQLGLAQEGVALACGQVFSRAIGGMQPHADLRGRRGRLWNAGSKARRVLAGARG